MTALWAHLGIIWTAAAVLMSVAWAISWRVRNVGWVDVFWAGGMGTAAVYAGVFMQGALLPRVLVATLGGLWALRLCLHLARRVAAEPEDGRYRALRDHWDGSQTRFFMFFQGQALFVVLFSVPFLVAASSTQYGWTIINMAALLVWLVAVAGEAMADRQLAAFRRDPRNRGETCRTGLWAWSRHPNYFFEWLHWFTYALLALGAPLWWLGFTGPVVMLVFLYRITGIPWTEQQALRSRGENYARYQREVSPFIPWPPKHPSSTINP